jgi:hypothetical protein
LLLCSAPPVGRARWTLPLLADQPVVLEIVDTISAETVRDAKNRVQASA